MGTDSEVNKSTVLSIFNELAHNHRDRIAVEDHQGTLTYSELNIQSNDLADHLLSECTNFETCDSPRIAFCLQNPRHMIVAILSIFKAGAAFVPLDIDAPEKRQVHILENANVTLLLTDTHLPWAPTCPTINITALPSPHHTFANTHTPLINSSDLAYIIYTSGSTGEPKGVMIEHAGLLNVAMEQIRLFGIKSNDRIMQFAAPHVDAAIAEWAQALISGACLCLLSKQAGQTRTQALLKTAPALKPSVITLPPTVALSLPENVFPSIKTLIFAGEPVPEKLLTTWRDRAQLFNAYGPTEATVCTTIHQYNNSSCCNQIGSPIKGMSTLVLNEQMESVAPNEIGELYISGIGLAKAYCNDSKLTDDKFINTIIPGQRFYRSGDKVRLLDNGELEYIARTDHQLKIAGFRVDPGEIESILCNHSDIAQAIVGLGKDSGLLEAHVVSLRDIDEEELVLFLSERLPDYMRPKSIKQHKDFPTTAWGKADRSNLLSSRPEKEIDINKATEDSNSILLSIFNTLLPGNEISANDDFFALGGDSILAIQLVVEAEKRGLVVDIGDIFEFPTANGLALKAKPVHSDNHDTKTHATCEKEKSQVTPIMHWFYEQKIENPNFYNQTVLLELHQPLTSELLKRFLLNICQAHPTLTMRSTVDELGIWSHSFHQNAINNSLLIQSDSLDQIDEANHGTYISDTIETLQRKLCIAHGPVVAAMIFSIKRRPKYLFIAINHLYVDTVSWRILLDDLQVLYRQYQDNQPLALLPEQTGYFDWAKQLYNYANTSEMGVAVQWWSSHLPDEIQDLPADKPGGINDNASSNKCVISLDVEYTHRLVKEVPKALNTYIHEILVSALFLSYCRWSSQPSLLIHMEGHGREPIIKGANISRTVGWFTSLFPLYLSMPPGKRSIRETLLTIKELIRSLPQKGVSYGIARYLQDSNIYRYEIETKPFPQISFNYMGRTETTNENHPLFSFSTLDRGAYIAAENHRQHLIDIAGEISNGCLNLDFIYSTNHFSQAHIQKWTSLFEATLKQIIDYCCNSDHFTYTPSDFNCPKLTQAELDYHFGKTDNLVNLYPLTPMQSGLLLYHLKAPGDDTYIVQSVMRYRGKIDQVAFKQAWQALAQHHAIFRKGIIWSQLSQPLQFELEEIKHPLTIQTIPTDTSIETYIKELSLQERRRGFNLNTPPLSRLHLLLNENEEHYLLWTHHHIILDGGSDGLIWHDFWKAYDQLQNHNSVSLNAIQPFEEYVQWLNQQPLNQSAWVNYLENHKKWCLSQNYINNGCDEQPIVKTPEAPNLHVQISNQCKQWGITLHSFFHGVWSALLHILSQQDDVLHGATLSGRTVLFPKIEDMTGLFINTLPVRTHVDANNTIINHFKNAQKTLAFLNAHCTTPLSTIHNWLNMNAGQQLFDTVLVFENYDFTPRHQALKHEVPWQRCYAIEKSEYPLTISVFAKEGLRIEMLFNENSMCEATVQSLADYYLKLIIETINPTHRTLGDILATCHRRVLKPVWKTNHSHKQYISPKSIHGLMIEEMRKHPHNTAIRYRGTALTYRDVLEQAEYFSKYLQRQGVTENACVALCFSRSPSFAICQLAILMAGATFLPIDPNNPVSRIVYMLEQSKAQTLVCANPLHSISNMIDIQTILLAGDSDNPRLVDAQTLSTSPSNTPETFGSENIAYIIFTSGSSGQPKGIKISHNNLINLVLAQRERLSITQYDRVLNHASVGFDAAIWEWASAWSNGACLCILPPLHQLDDINENLKSLKPTHALIVPTLLARLTPTAFPDLKTLIVGGEPITAAQVSLWREHTQIINAYGPAETTVLTTFFEFDQKHPATTIGRPISNSQVLILDYQRRPVPIGVSGEIYVGGRGVGVGYLNDAQAGYETVPESLKDEVTSTRIYKTGDLGRYLSDGEIEYIGRADRQVKVRGYRVELDEIEKVLTTCPGIKLARVSFTSSPTNSINASVETDETANGELTSEKIQNYCREKLPDYMMPNGIQITRLETTLSGKLAFPDVTHKNDAETTQRNNKPETEVEKLLWRCWSKILNSIDFGMHDNFFRLGGDSINCIEVASYMEANGYQVTISDIFSSPTIHQLSGKVSTLAKKQKLGLPPTALPLLPKQVDYVWRYFHQKDTTNGFVQNRIYFNQPLDVQHVQSVWQELIIKYDSLRCIFHPNQANEQQVIDHANVEVSTQDLSRLGENEVSTALNEFLQNDKNTSLDWQAAPLMRLCVVQLPKNTSVLLWSFHHIIADAWSRKLLLDEFVSTYNAHKHQSVSSANPGGQTSSSLADYSHWASSQNLRDAKKFWCGHLSDITKITRFQRKYASQSRYADLEFSLPEETTTALKKTAAHYKVTLSTLIHGAWLLTQKEHLNSNHLLIGVTLNGRHIDMPGIQQAVGMFANTLPLLFRLDYKTLEAIWLQNLQKAIYQLNDYIFVSEAQIRQWLNLSPDYQLYDSLIMMASLPLTTPHAATPHAELRIEQDIGGSPWGIYPLGLSTIPESYLRFKLGYDTSYFSPNNLASLKKCFLRHLGAETS